LTDIYGRLDIAEDGHLRYFGASSYFNMLKRPQYDSDTAGPHSPSSFGSTTFPLHSPTRVDLPNEVQNHLLDLYWKWQNPWQYLVHKDAFCRALEQGHYDEYCTPLLLHSVLALAARYSDDTSLRTDPSDANTAGDALQRTAKIILQSEVEHPTVSTVVSLANLPLREMSTNKEALGWTYIGEITFEAIAKFF
jgi:Fungal specific transcription factor domain